MASVFAQLTRGLGQIHFVGKSTRLSHPGPSWLSCLRESIHSLINPLPDMPILGYSNSENKDNYDVKNIDKWGYKYLIE